MRLFYAAYLSPENMRAYQDLVDRLIEEVPGTLRSVPQQTHHLTLAFLGELDERETDACLSALDGVKRFDAFRFSLGKPDILMGRGRPRLIHATVNEKSRSISEIQSRLIAVVRASCPSIDTRPKPPHVTLARFPRNSKKWQARRVRQALEQTDDSCLPKTDRLSHVHLVESTLGPSGPSYETLRQVRLKA